MNDVVLEVNDLHTYFNTDDGQVPAVEGVNFKLHKGEVLGIVGESGCGKSVTSLSIMQLIPKPPGEIVKGQILFNDKNLAQQSEKQMKRVRGNEIAMIFQEPMTSLDPLFTIGNQMIEAIQIHQRMNKKEARLRAIQMLKKVGIPRAEAVVDEYPHQLSGGMRQRVMIAMAMSCDPDILIADEPTTALDVTIQAQILDLMRSLNKEVGTAILLITHDLGVVAEMCDRVIVMYSGQIVEEGTVREILKDPKHPYTLGLIKSLPKIEKKEEKLYSIPGTVMKPKLNFQGCRFASRCEFAFDRCFQESPTLFSLDDERKVSCFLYDDDRGVESGK